MKRRTATRAIWVLATSGLALGCSPSTTSSPSPTTDAGAVAVADGGIPIDDEDASVTDSGPSTSGTCAGGAARPSATEMAALNQLLGRWTITSADDPSNNKRTYTFGPYGAPSGNYDVGCDYAEHGYIDFTNDQIDLGYGRNDCQHIAAHYRLHNKGVPNAYGFVEGYYQLLKPDGTPNTFLKELSASWQRAAAVLNFNGQHFDPGGTYVCTP